MDSGLKGKVVVVTGGSSGIGLAAVRLFLGEGARVAFCGRDEDRLDGARRSLEEDFGGDDLLAMICDVLEVDQVEAFRDAVADRFGATDVLVNNAGRAGHGSLTETTDEDWREELDLKFFSILRPTHAFLPMIEKSDCGAIVCINAMLSRRPEPRMIATSAARAGVLNLAKSMSRELAPKGIRVNSILLGLIESGQWYRRYDAASPEGVSRDEWLAGIAQERGIPLGRLGRPEEPAAAIVFLASPLAGYTTGAALDLSGGQSLNV